MNQTPQIENPLLAKPSRPLCVSGWLLAGASLTGALVISSGCNLGQRAGGQAGYSPQQVVASPTISSIDGQVLSSDISLESDFLRSSGPQHSMGPQHSSGPQHSMGPHSSMGPSGQYALAGPSEAELLSTSHMPPSPQSPQDCVDGWDVFQAPHLRVLQTRAIENGVINGIRSGGGSFQGPHTQTRSLLKQVTEAYIDVRYNLERLQDSYEVLSIQEQAVVRAKQRKAEGKAGRMDVLQAESAIGLTKSRMTPMTAKLQSSIDHLESLTGATIAPAMLKGIVNSPQLSMPNLDRKLPASILRQRHDVRLAEQQVVSMGVQAGIPEVAMMPHLSLQGELTAKNDEGGDQAKSINDSLDLNLGSADTWSFTADSLAGSSGSPNGLPGNGYSPIPDTMRSFQSTVFSAAGEVEQLLTQYHQALANVQATKRTKSDASEAARLALQQFQVDRIEGSYVANAQNRRAEAGQALADASARLASIAVALLVATGGDCYPDLDPVSVYAE